MVQASVGFHCPECARQGRQRVYHGRAALAPARPIVTQVLIAINVGVFVLGFILQYAFAVYPNKQGWPDWTKLRTSGLGPDTWTLFFIPTGEQWRFLVVDEAHVYDGATGIEVGMLLRRLRDRVLRGGRGLRCIATSATLGRGEADFPAAAAFARELFDEPFASGDVFTAVRKTPGALHGLARLWLDPIHKLPHVHHALGHLKLHVDARAPRPLA